MAAGLIRDWRPFRTNSYNNKLKKVSTVLTAFQTFNFYPKQFLNNQEVRIFARVAYFVISEIKNSFQKRVQKISHSNCSNWPINYFKVADFIRLRCDEEFVQWLDMAHIDRDGQNFEVSNAICPTSRSDSTVRTILQFDKYVCSVLESMGKSVRTIQSKNQRFLAFEGNDWKRAI